MAFWSSEERLRRQAAAWFARMHAPDADRYRFAFRAWVTRDPRHGDAYERLLGHWDTAELLRHRASIEAAAPPPLAKAALPWLVPALAAMIIGMTAIGLAVGRDAALLRGGIGSGLAQRKVVALADGSRVTLDADSVIAPAFSSRRRWVRVLRGRARFSVAHEASRPFVVAAAGTLVTAHGTLFDVDLIGPGRTDVVLLQGTVDVARRRAFGLLPPARIARLAGPETARLDRGRVRIAAPVVTPLGGDWTSGVLSFDRAPLAEVLADANRYSARKIRLASPGLGDLEITGVFHAGVTPDLAASLARALGLTLTTAANGDLRLGRRAA